MGTHTAYRSVVQYNDFVRVADGGGALGNDEHSRVVVELTESLSEGGVSGIVKGGGTVVEDQNIGLSNQRSRNGKALSLTS